MPTVQMNTRLDGRIKKCGDAALAQAGYTPSQTVRAVWEYAASHSREPQVIKQLFESIEIDKSSDREDRIAQKKAALSQIPQLRDELEMKLGVSLRSTPDNRPFERLRDEALLSRWEERGLL